MLDHRLNLHWNIPLKFLETTETSRLYILNVFLIHVYDLNFILGSEGDGGADDHCARHGISTFGSMTPPDILFIYYVKFILVGLYVLLSFLFYYRSRGRNDMGYQPNTLLDYCWNKKLFQ